MVPESEVSPSTDDFNRPQQDDHGLYQDYAALDESAGLVAFDNDGVFSITGRDRVDWLHKLTTANMQALREGRGAYGLVLNGTAHVIADFVVLALAESLTLYSSQNAAEKLYAQLRRSLFRERVAIHRDDGHVVLSLQGSRSQQILDETYHGLPPLERFQFLRKGNLLIIQNPRAGRDGYDLVVPRVQVGATADALTRHGARRVSSAAVNVARIEAGVPWYGEDYDETMLVLEARLDRFIAEDKGCYPGQEVIARIHNRGHVNRLLVQLLFEGDSVPQRGDLVFSGDREVGWITSPTWSFAHKRPLALGYIRRELAEKGARVQVKRGTERIEGQVLGP